MRIRVSYPKSSDRMSNQDFLIPPRRGQMPVCWTLSIMGRTHENSTFVDRCKFQILIPEHTGEWSACIGQTVPSGVPAHEDEDTRLRLPSGVPQGLPEEDNVCF